ncbi:histone-lysine N-methyltransferase ATX2-like protein isoform X1 [Tanacetum coccineum]
MLQLRNGVGNDLEGDGKKDEGSGDSKKTCLSTELVETKFKGTKSGPFIVGDLEVLKLGKMVKDLNCVNDDGSIRPLGYTATRKFPSLADLSVCSVYKMEVLRDTSKQTQPLFKVSTNNGDQGTSNSKLTSKSTCHMPAGYRPVHVKWKDLDKCNVCHMDEEYANNLFLQCDKCRMMVHGRCYRELEPVD